MPANYVLLNKVTLGASAASVTFSNIPQTGYTDLKLVISARDARTDVEVSNIYFNFNSTGAGTNYSGRYIYGTGSLVFSSTAGISGGAAAFSTGAINTASTFSNSEVYIPNYTSSNYKSLSSDSSIENNGTPGFNLLLAGLWSNTTAINSIAMTPLYSPFAANSSFYLYGLAAVGTTPVIAPFASGGDVITNDGTYWYHAFLSSGNFVPGKALTCDYLVVGAGGGGGTNYYGGGGGAGGYRSATSQSLAANTIYATVVGAGGSGGSTNTSLPTNGNDSIFNSFTSSGGGYGGSEPSGWAVRVGGVGASGGGGCGVATTTAGGAGNTPSTSPVQGYAGGSGRTDNASYGVGGGGGGATAVGANASGTVAGNGGAGSNTFSSWLSTVGAGVSGYLAGGGGGGSGTSGTSVTPGTGGAGGGGNGGPNGGSGSAALRNTGSGGGGAGASGSGGSGGSGIIIVRYSMV